MRSLLTSADGAIAAVTAQGFLVESTVPFAGRRRRAARAVDLRRAAQLPLPLGARALRALGSEARAQADPQRVHRRPQAPAPPAVSVTTR